MGFGIIFMFLYMQFKSESVNDMKENKGEQFLHESLRKEMDHASRWKLLFWPFLSQPFSQCKIRDCGDDFARLKNQVKTAKLYGNLVKVVCAEKLLLKISWLFCNCENIHFFKLCISDFFYNACVHAKKSMHYMLSQKADLFLP